MKVTNHMIHPQLRRVGRMYKGLSRMYSEKNFHRMQRMMPLARRFMTSNTISCSQRIIQTPHNPALRVCVYQPLKPSPHAVGLLWFHGGGYAIGAPEQDLHFYQNFIDAANCVIISPDYTLSTKAPYPAALNDCYDTLLWMSENADALGISKDRLMVGGDSAGGGLAAAVSLMARDKGEVNITFQMPFYPMLDDRVTPSSKDNDAPVWNAKTNEIAWKMYLGDLYGKPDIPVYAAPARETNYANLPPTYTFVGDIEPFYDETSTYIQNLQAAGVNAEIDVYEGCFHAFDLPARKLDIGRKAIDTYIQKFQMAVENSD